VAFETPYAAMSERSLYEGSKAEVGQVIAGMKLPSFLTQDMASKNDA